MHGVVLPVKKKQKEMSKEFCMKKLVFCLLLLQGCMQAVSDFTLSPIASPKFSQYNRLLFKFNKHLYQRYSIPWRDIYPFEIIMYALWYNSDNRIFLEIKQNDLVIGFAWCQVMSPSYLYIRQFVLDPELYDLELLQNVLLRLFRLMPGMQQLTVQCPSVFADVKVMLLAFGFKQSEQDIKSVDGVFERYDWSAG